jgi:hypothetical protein
MGWMTKAQVLAWRRGFEEAERATLAMRMPASEAFAQACELYELARAQGLLPASKDPIRRDEDERARAIWARLRARLGRAGEG